MKLFLALLAIGHTQQSLQPSCSAVFPTSESVLVGKNAITHFSNKTLNECCTECEIGYSTRDKLVFLVANKRCAAFDLKQNDTAINCWLHSDTTCVPANHGPRVSGVMCRTHTATCNFTCPPAPIPPPSPHPPPSPPRPRPPPPSPSPPPPPPPTSVNLRVSIDPHIIHTVLPEYASVDLDYWHNTTMSGGSWGNASILTINLTDTKLTNLVAALEPVFIRLGGSEDVIVQYEYGGMSLEDCERPLDFRGEHVSLCITKEKWQQVLDFYNRTAASLVFGTSYSTRHNHGSGEWDEKANFSNIEALLQFTANAAKVRVAGLELGEEMSPYDEAGFNQLVAAYGELKQIVAKIWTPTPAPSAIDYTSDSASSPSQQSHQQQQQRPKILGPSTGMGQESTSNKFMQRFLNTTLEKGFIDGVNVHSYNNDGGWPRPGFLSQTLEQAEAMREMTRWTSPTAEMWCGECGPHNGGGLPGVTDTMTSSFWYMDALGGLAKAGYSQHGRQALVGSHYGLLEETTHTPNPDYWALLGWKRFMGTGVLNVSLTVVNDGSVVQPPEGFATGGHPHPTNYNDSLHIYAHCTRPSKPTPRSSTPTPTPTAVGETCGGGDLGSITIAFINISPSITFKVDMEGASAAVAGFPARSAAGTVLARSEYHFTSGNSTGSTLTKIVLLNNKLLQLSKDASVPPFSGVTVENKAPLSIKPYSFGFARIEPQPL